MKKYTVTLRKGNKGSMDMDNMESMYDKKYMKNGMGMKNMYGKKDRLSEKNLFDDSGRNWFKNPPSSFKVMGNLRGYKGFNLRK